MYYVSSDTIVDPTTRRQRRGGPANHVIVVKDTDNPDFLIRVPWRDLPEELFDKSIHSEDVVGLYQSGSQTMIVTPVSMVELSVFKLLSNPHYYERPACEGGHVSWYGHRGYYNFIMPDGQYSNIAHLLLGMPLLEVNIIGGSIEVGRNSIAVCIDDYVGSHDTLDGWPNVSDPRVKYIRYDLVSFDALQRIRLKYRALDMQKTLHSSFQIHWEGWH